MNRNPNMSLTPQQQIEMENILRRRMTEKKLNMLDHISEDDFKIFKEIIEVQFGELPAPKFKISNTQFLEIYRKVYREDVTEFNLIEWGVLADMVYVEMPYSKCMDSFEELEDFLEFKIRLESLFIVFNMNKNICMQETEREFSTKASILRPHVS